ncbi:MAG: isoprenylcysteine carboxylmethyltransferase family protein [Anaerolineales bacterium]
MNLHIAIYLSLVLLYRIAEYWAMNRTGSLMRPSRSEASALLISVPYYLILIGPVVEYFWFNLSPTLISMLLGGLFFLAAMIVRTKAHLDLGRAFSMYIEENEQHNIVRRGLYAHIRHPLYLGNILLFIACPLFLQSTFTWIITAIGVAGVLRRIRVEEQFLAEQTSNYKQYKSETWALLPGIY